MRLFFSGWWENMEVKIRNRMDGSAGIIPCIACLLNCSSTYRILFTHVHFFRVRYSLFMVCWFYPSDFYTRGTAAMILDKKQMTEENIKLNYITPAINRSEWVNGVNITTILFYWWVWDNFSLNLAYFRRNSSLILKTYCFRFWA